MPKITNVEVGLYSQHADFVLSCHSGDARYHVWLSRENRLINKVDGKATLFKNSIQTERNKPGYFQTRKLDPEAAFGKAVIEQMMAQAQAGDLFTKAEARLNDGRRKELLGNEIASTKKCHEPFTEQMVMALRNAYAALQAATGFDGNMFAGEPLDVIAEVRDLLTAIDDAEATVGDNYAAIWQREGLGEKQKPEAAQ